MNSRYLQFLQQPFQFCLDNRDSLPLLHTQLRCQLARKSHSAPEIPKKGLSPIRLGVGWGVDFIDLFI